MRAAQIASPAVSESRGIVLGMVIDPNMA